MYVCVFQFLFYFVERVVVKMGKEGKKSKLYFGQNKAHYHRAIAKAVFVLDPLLIFFMSLYSVKRHFNILHRRFNK